MDIVDLVRMLRRRLALTFALGLILIVTLGVIALAVPAQFRATGTVLAIRQGASVGSNPFAVVDPSQRQAATLLVTMLNSPRGKAELKRAGATGEIEISNESGSIEERTPFITVDVTAGNPAAARRSAEVVVGQARAYLHLRQQDVGVPIDQELLLVDVVTPTAATPSHAAQLRALALGGALGLVLLVSAVAITDRVRGGAGGKKLPGHSGGPGGTGSGATQREKAGGAVRETAGGGASEGAPASEEDTAPAEDGAGPVGRQVPGEAGDAATTARTPRASGRKRARHRSSGRTGPHRDGDTDVTGPAQESRSGGSADGSRDEATEPRIRAADVGGRKPV